jgi:hypothetical protein
MQDADSMPSLLLTACVLSKSVQYTYNCSPGTLRKLDMRRLESSLGLRLAVLQTCKVLPAGLRHVSGFNDRRLVNTKEALRLAYIMHAFPIYIYRVKKS